ncbi:hypothetical protein [Streptomyces sp. NPDC056190]|uniref:hypothetical protein n=1 Tax=unclassified Streptomyces TaxID=2593676 RepID=UPI0035E3A9E2
MWRATSTPTSTLLAQLLDLDDLAWTRARAWAIAVGVSGISYYWHTFPAFVAECQARLQVIVTDAAAR